MAIAEKGLYLTHNSKDSNSYEAAKRSVQRKKGKKKCLQILKDSDGVDGVYLCCSETGCMLCVGGEREREKGTRMSSINAGTSKGKMVHAQKRCIHHLFVIDGGDAAA